MYRCSQQRMALNQPRIQAPTKPPRNSGYRTTISRRTGSQLFGGQAVALGSFRTSRPWRASRSVQDAPERGRSMQGECTESESRRVHLEAENAQGQTERKLPVAPEKALDGRTDLLSAQRSNRHAPVVSPLNTPSAAPIRTGHGLRASADAMAPPPKRHPFTPCPKTPAPSRRPRGPALSPGNLPDRAVERAWRAGAGWNMSRSTECRSRSTTGPGPAGGAASDPAV